MSVNQNLKQIVRSKLVTASNITIVIVVFIASCLSAFALDERVFFSEGFNNLDNWEPLYFNKIDKHTRYSIIKEGEQSYVRAESDSSASGMVYKHEFNIYDYPNLKWRWKVTNIYESGNAETKEGDDYPIRMYVMFKYDPDKASFGRRLKYGLAKKMYGTYPPQSTLNYIWANREHKESILTNSYAKEARMIILQTGIEHTGKWIDQKVNILEDYRRAFGEDPPQIASIAIMNDSDNTGESSVSFIDFIEVYK